VISQEICVAEQSAHLFHRAAELDRPRPRRTLKALDGPYDRLLSRVLRWRRLSLRL
jgi:hypothetical protein